MTVSTDASPPNAAAPSRRARGRLVTAAIASLSMVVAGEVLLRGCVGLGDPPLYARHPTIEYILRPGSYRPFGNDFHVNAASMRSPDSATGPLSAGERRVLVLGDSIVCGGNSVPDGALATTLLAESLGSGDGASCVSICNVSAGSWGPRNLLAYLEEHGTFGAEVAIVVLNSADWTDVPTFEDLGPDRPERRPALALVELCTRYLPRLIPFGAGERAPADIGESVTAEADIEALVGLLRARGLRVAVVLHPAASELGDGGDAAFAPFRVLLRRLGVPMVEFAPTLAEAVSRGEAPYRDGLHLSAAGQARLAGTLAEAVRLAR